MGWKVQGSNPGGGEIFCTYPDQPWGPPSHLYNGYQVFPGGKGGRGVALTTHHHLVPRSWKSRVIPLLPLWAHVACYRVNHHTCKNDHFGFYFVSIFPSLNWDCVWLDALWSLGPEVLSGHHVCVWSSCRAFPAWWVMWSHTQYLYSGYAVCSWQEHWGAETRIITVCV